MSDPPQQPLAPEPPQRPERRTLSILLSADIFADLIGGLLERDFGDQFVLRFLKFGSETELRHLALEERPNLAFLYIGNILWNPRPPGPPGPPPQGCSNALYACYPYTLGEISARSGVPILATQGTDLRADADRAGIIFPRSPFHTGEPHAHTLLRP